MNLQVPETVEEFDTNAKRAGACLQEATNNVVYRGLLGEFRDVLIHGREAEDGVAAVQGLEDIYSFPRATKPVLGKDGKPKVVDGVAVTEPGETEQEYIDRLMAAKSLTTDALQKVAAVVAASIPFDASARERKAPKPPKLSNELVEAAKAQLAGHDDSYITKALQKFLPEATFARSGDEAADVQTLGKLLRDWVKARTSAMLQKF